MGSKRTHKLRAMGDVQAVIDRTADLTAAARELGVDRSTITRWMQAGKIKAKPQVELREGKTPPPPPTATSWAEWAPAVRDAYVLSPTDTQLVALAEKALALVYDEDKAVVQLMAMARFAALVKQLNLQQAAPVQAQAPTSAPPRPLMAARSVVRSTADPRAILMAVK